MSISQRKSSFSQYKLNQFSTFSSSITSSNIDEIKEEYPSPLFPASSATKQQSPLLFIQLLLDSEMDPIERRISYFFEEKEINFTDPRQKEFSYFLSRKQQIKQLRNQSTLDTIPQEEETTTLLQKIEDCSSVDNNNASNKKPQSILIQKSIRKSSLLVKRGQFKQDNNTSKDTNDTNNILQQLLTPQIHSISIQQSMLHQDSLEIKSQMSCMSLDCAEARSDQNIACENQIFFSFQNKQSTQQQINVQNDNNNSNFILHKLQSLDIKQ